MAKREEGTMATEPRLPAMVVGVDDSEHSAYALEWTLHHFFSPTANTPVPFKLVIVHSKPTAASIVGLARPGVGDMLPSVDKDPKKISTRVIERAKGFCVVSAVPEVQYEVVEGDPRNVLCEAVDRHQADMLVVGSHGYGMIKRAVLGSVSDYCAHHAHCTVMIVKKPKQKH